jgi:hypothetical protein
MDTVLLFRKRTPLTDDRLPWLRGSEEHTWTARCNTSGKGVVSAILVRALLSALEGSVLEAHPSRSVNHVRAVVRSHSTPDTVAWLLPGDPGEEPDLLCQSRLRCEAEQQAPRCRLALQSWRLGALLAADRPGVGNEIRPQTCYRTRPSTL